MKSIVSYASQDFEQGIGYVYKWTNIITGKMYIGSHKGNNPKYLGSGIDFLAAVKEYGIDNFYREMLYKGPNFGVVEVEILKAINARQSLNFYNRVNTWSEGTLGSHVNLGIPKSQAHREAISKGLKLLPNGENHPSYGFRHSEETKQKMSEAKRGEKHPRWGKFGEDNPLFGYKHSEEAKANMSKASKGKSKSAEHAANISKGLSGRKAPIDQILKSSFTKHIRNHVEQGKKPAKKKPCRWCNGDTLEQAIQSEMTKED